MSISTLTQRTHSLQKRLAPPRTPKTWLAILTSDVLPEALARQLQPQDTLIIREIPPGYMPDDEPVFYQIPRHR